MFQLTPAPRTRGTAITTVIISAFALTLVAIAAWTVTCPCERTPGGYLLGDVVTAPVADWSFVNDEVGLCQIQVQRGLLPHSVNLNCMSANGDLYLSCANCDGKAWSTAALNHPAARIRMHGRVYPVTLTRVVDPSELDSAWRAREAKLGRDVNRPRQKGWWSFRAASRS